MAHRRGRIMIRTRVVRGIVVVLSVGFVAACGGSPESEASADEAAVDTVSTDTAAQQASAPAAARPDEESRSAGSESGTGESAPREESTPADDAEEAPATEASPPAATTAMTLATGSQMTVQLDDTLSTRTTAQGDRFTARVPEAIMRDGRVLIPDGSTVHGRVTAVQEADESDTGQGVIKLAFDSVTVRGTGYSLAARVLEANPETQSSSSTAEDAAKVGGAAAAGAILGRVIGGDRTGTAVGAAVGAAAGTAVVLVTKRGYAVLPAGSNLTLELTDPLTVEVPAQTDGDTP